MTGKNDEVFHLLRCLITMALADSVLHEAETELLGHLVRSLGQLDAEMWERAWDDVQSGMSTRSVLESVPNNERLHRFILREMVTLALADGIIAEAEHDTLAMAAAIFALEVELDRFVDWAYRAQAIAEEGDRLLEPEAP